MVAPQQLAHPPIAEALVDFRTITDTPVGIDRLQSLRDELKPLFPTLHEQKHANFEFKIEGGKLMPPLTRDLGILAVASTSGDGHRIVQFRTDGMTFNNVGIGAYLGGDALIEEALQLWTRYSAIAKPTAVVRLAMRYINRLDLPLRDGEEFRRFLTAPPELPDGAPQKVSSFLGRIVAHDETGVVAIVTQKLEAGAYPVPVVIDVDVFMTEELDPTPEKLRGFLQNLRRIKNQTFFALLTAEAVNLYL